jgi:hypothetical protein
MWKRCTHSTYSTYGCLIFCVDGGNCAASSDAAQQICLFYHQDAVFEILGNQVIPHLGVQAEEEHGHEGGASVAST